MLVFAGRQDICLRYPPLPPVVPLFIVSVRVDEPLPIAQVRHRIDSGERHREGPVDDRCSGSGADRIVRELACMRS